MKKGIMILEIGKFLYLLHGDLRSYMHLQDIRFSSAKSAVESFWKVFLQIDFTYVRGEWFVYI